MVSVFSIQNMLRFYYDFESLGQQTALFCCEPFWLGYAQGTLIPGPDAMGLEVLSSPVE